MASERKPSIYEYDDRSNIGSSSELDKYGVWIKSEPQDLSSVGAETEDAFESADFSGPMDFAAEDDADAAGSDRAEETAEDSILDLGDFDTGMPSDMDREVSFEPEGFDREPAAPEDAGLGESTGGEGPKDDPHDPAIVMKDEDAGGFAEISLDDFLGNPDGGAPPDESPVLKEEEPAAPPPAEKSGGQELSTQLLIRIADELSSIRNELSSLKEEFSVIRSGGAAPAPAAAEGTAHGFFDEEDDEKIALTGDELNNIINTADFTEEVGVEVLPDPPDETGGGGADEELSFSPFQEEDFSLDEGLPPAGEEPELDLGGLTFDEPAADEPALAEMREEDFAFPEKEEAAFSPDDGDEPDRFQAAVPSRSSVTEDTPSFDEPSPADTEGFDILSDENFDEDPLDLTGAVIDEPNLSLDLEENQDENPLPDNIPREESPFADSFEKDSLEDNPLEAFSINLDLEEPEEISVQAEVPSFDDGVISFEDGVPSFEEEVPLFEEGEEEPPKILEDFLDLPEESPSLRKPGEDEDGEESLIPEGFIVDADDAPLLPEEAELAETALADEALGDLGFLEEEPEEPVEELRVKPSGRGEILPFPGTEPPEESERVRGPDGISPAMTRELRTVLSYMDRLLESLPEEKIEEFAQSEYFDSYKKLFKELGLG